MALPFTGTGGVTAPVPVGPIGSIAQRILGLRDLSPSKGVLRAVDILGAITRAEEAAVQGVSGELLDRVIGYLEQGDNKVPDIRMAVDRVRKLPPATCDSGYM